MASTYQPIAPAFHEELKKLVKQRAGVRLQFYTDINEFLTRHATLKQLITKGEEEYLELTTGEEIRLDKIVRLNDRPAPGYDDEFFKCDTGR